SIAKQESRGRVRKAWPLLLVGAALAYGIPAASSLAGAALYAVLLGWTIYTFLLLRKPGNVGRVVVGLIAGMSLLDAVLIARAGLPGAGAVAAFGFPLTLLFQRYVRGT
ncbi:MAG: UbiA family prenyltransferase, partial [Longimicrobiales bacterium]